MNLTDVIIVFSIVVLIIFIIYRKQKRKKNKISEGCAMCSGCVFKENCKKNKK